VLIAHRDVSVPSRIKVDRTGPTQCQPRHENSNRNTLLNGGEKRPMCSRCFNIYGRRLVQDGTASNDGPARVHMGPLSQFINRFETPGQGLGQSDQSAYAGPEAVFHLRGHGRGLKSTLTSSSVNVHDCWSGLLRCRVCVLSKRVNNVNSVVGNRSCVDRHAFERAYPTNAAARRCACSCNYPGYSRLFISRSIATSY
jgi:hypothetical protein